MEDFQQLEQGRQDELLQPFNAFEQNLQHQKIIAVIRESSVNSKKMISSGC